MVRNSVVALRPIHVGSQITRFLPFALVPIWAENTAPRTSNLRVAGSNPAGRAYQFLISKAIATSAVMPGSLMGRTKPSQVREMDPIRGAG